MYIKLLFIGALALWFFSSSCQNSSVQSMTAQDVHTILSSNPNVFLLDVRTPEEHQAGYISGTDANVNWFNWRQEITNTAIPKNQTVVVYCRSGNRSGKASKWLAEQGYKNVVNLTGGYMAWQDAGFDIAQ